MCGKHAKIEWFTHARYSFLGIHILSPLMFVYLVSAGKFHSKFPKIGKLQKGQFTSLTIPTSIKAAHNDTLSCRVQSKIHLVKILCVLAHVTAQETTEQSSLDSKQQLKKSPRANIPLHSKSGSIHLIIHPYHKIHNIHSQQNPSTIDTP